MAEAKARIVITARDDTANALAKARVGFQRLQGDATRITSAFAGMGGAIAAAFGGVGITALVKGVTDGIDALNDLKDATGASIENISALEDVGARAGLAFEKTADILLKFNQFLGNAKAGSEQERILKSIGLSAEELRKQDPAEALRQTAVALAGFADNGKRARFEQEIFSKLTKDSAKFLKDLGAETELVAKVTARQAAETKKFNDQLDALSKNTKDASRALVSDFLPVLNQIAANVSRLGVRGTLLANLGLDKLGRDSFALKAIQVDIDDTASKIADLREAVAKEPANRGFSQALEFQLAEMRRLLAEAARLSDSVKGAADKIGSGPSGRRPPNEGGGKFILPDVPDIPTGKPKRAAFTAEENRALTDALRALEQTEVSKIAALNAQLSELFNLQRETRGDPAVAEAIRATREELDKLRAANIGPAILDPLQQIKQDFLRSEKLDTVFDDLPEKLKEVSTFAQEAGRNIQDALGDTLSRTLRGDFESIGQLWRNLIIDMVAQALGAQLGKALLGDLGKTGSIGGIAGDLFKFIGLPGFAVGTPYVPQDMVAVVHKGERIIPAAQNKPGAGGFTFNNVYNIGQGVSRGEVAAAVRAGNLELEGRVRRVLAKAGAA